MVVQPYISWTPLVSPGVVGVLHTWDGSMFRYPMAGGAFVVGFLLGMSWCGMHGPIDFPCGGASVGIRDGVCLCARHVVSVMFRVRLLAFPPNRRCRYWGALFAMVPFRPQRWWLICW